MENLKFKTSNSPIVNELAELTSFIVTGASATGKTTLVEQAMKIGYQHLATHTTRPKRHGEVDKVHGVYLNEKEFEANFDEEIYLEDSLDFAKLHSTGIYYGTPRIWEEELVDYNTCATPVSISIARKVFDNTGVKWLHLVCEDNDRSERLRSRGIDSTELSARMHSGDSRLRLPSDAEIFDTSTMNTDYILQTINRSYPK